MTDLSEVTLFAVRRDVLRAAIEIMQDWRSNVPAEDQAVEHEEAIDLFTDALEHEPRIPRSFSPGVDPPGVFIPGPT